MTFNAGAIGKVLYSLINSTVVVNPTIAPQNTSDPYCIYSILRTEPDDVKDGVSLVDTVTVLLSVYHNSYSSAATLGDSVRAILDGYRGTAGGVYVDTIVYVTESDDYEDETRKYIKIQEYTLRILNT